MLELRAAPRLLPGRFERACHEREATGFHETYPEAAVPLSAIPRQFRAQAGRLPGAAGFQKADQAYDACIAQDERNAKYSPRQAA